MEARLGSLGTLPFLPCPPLPNIVAEWAAVLPLVCHLATQRDDYNIVGEVALRGNLSVGLFPRLGTLCGLSRLLSHGTKFLDLASVRGGSSRVVWDVRWGSTFPCVNGGACAAISHELLCRSKNPTPIRMPEKLPRKQPSPDSQNGRQPAAESGPQIPSTAGTHFRRYQTLSVFNLQRKPAPRASARRWLNKLAYSAPGRMLYLIALLGLSVALGLFGTYGTAAVVLVCAASESLAARLLIRRPLGFLDNNEHHDACMLVAPHNNAMAWHLFIGDRGIVDALLNKPMFAPPQGRAAYLMAGWLKAAHALQLGAMTFVAAQRGWDGVLLCLLMTLSRCATGFLRGRQAVVRDFLEREGVTADVKVFEFGSRNALMGAVQLFSGSDTTRWLDDIIVPHPRRDAFLHRILGRQPFPAARQDSLTTQDKLVVESFAEATLAALDVLESHFSRGRASPP